MVFLAGFVAVEGGEAFFAVVRDVDQHTTERTRNYNLRLLLLRQIQIRNRLKNLNQTLRTKTQLFNKLMETALQLLIVMIIPLVQLFIVSLIDPVQNCFVKLLDTWRA